MRKFTKLWKVLMILLISSSVLVGQAQNNVTATKAPAKVELKKQEQKAESKFTKEELNVLKEQGITPDKLNDKDALIKAEQIIKNSPQLQYSQKQLDVLNDKGISGEMLNNPVYQMKAEEIVGLPEGTDVTEINKGDDPVDYTYQYSFSQSTGTYTEITGGTVLGSTTSDDQRFVDPAVPLGGTTSTGVGFPIGFNFTFDGIVFDRIAINNNGWISLGQSALTPAVNITSTSSYGPLSSTSVITPDNLVSRIAGVAFDTQGQTGSELRIQIVGTSPNQECVIQWKGYRGYSATGDNLNFQIRLVETSNLVNIVFGTMTKGTSSTSVQVGLRAAPSATATNYTDRTTTTNWAATTAGASASATCTLSSSVYPSSGLTFTFTPPAPCVNPVNQPTVLVLTPASTSIAGSFTAAVGSDSYLVVRGPNATLSANPVNGTTYTVGGVLGDGTVVYSGPATTFSATGLTASTLYYFFVFSQNSVCSGGPLYLIASPLTGSKSTLPNPPASLIATGFSTSQINLTATANAAGDNIIVAWNTVNTFGVPTGTYNVGDPISGGGTVHYIGAAASLTNHTGLTSGTTYYYQAWSVVTGPAYSSTYVSANAATLCNAISAFPYNESFDGTTFPPTICWGRYTGLLAAPSTLTTTTSGWIQDDWRNIISGDKAARLNIWSTGLYYWLTTPQIDLGAGGYQLEFDLTLNAYGTSGPPALTGTDDKFAIIISTDGGTTWTSANSLRLYDNAGSTFVYNNINPNGETIVINTTAYTGIVKFGFYGESTISNADNDLMINNLKVRIPPACPDPSTLTVTSITANSANLGWTENGTATAWEYQYGLAGFTPAATGTATTLNPTPISGLLANTSYDFYVRANCGSGSFSAWSGPKNFKTPCSAYGIPWSENFDAMVIIGNNILPDCWLATSPSGTPWYSGNAASITYNDPCSSPNYVYVSWSPSVSDKFLITPGFTLTAATSYDFSFNWVGDGYNGWTGDVMVNSAQTGTGATLLGSSFVVATTTTTANCTLAKRSFIPATNGVYYFMVRVNNNSVPYYLGFDDFILELSPACPPPFDLTATGITANSANLGWTSTASAWEYQIGPTGFVPGPTGTATNLNPTPVSSLSASTSYDFYVRANCGGGIYSSWAGPKTFTTACAALSLPFSESFPTAAFPACWTEQLTGLITSNHWSMVNSNIAGGTPYEARAGWSPGQGATQADNDRLVSPPLNTTGLTSLHISFRQMLDDWAGTVQDAWIKVQSSTDGNTWTDEWVWNCGLGNSIPAQVKELTISNNLGGTTYIAWTLSGYTYDINYWYVDDINLTVPLAHDVATASIDMPAAITPGAVNPLATVKNNGINGETFNVNMTITPGTYSSTKSVTIAAGGPPVQVTFDPWPAALGSYTINVCTQLAGDLLPANDCKSAPIVVSNIAWTSGAAALVQSYMGTAVGYTSPTNMGYLFAIGGNTTSALKNELSIYDVVNNTWAAGANLPVARGIAASAVVGNKVYHIGGSDGTTYFPNCYSYDIATNIWTEIAPLPANLGWMKAVGYGTNYIYVAGGVADATTVVNTVYLYDIALNTWTACTSMPTAIFGGAFSLATGTNTLVYVGGADLSVITSTTYKGQIDPVTPTTIVWTTGTAYPGGTMYRFDAAPWCDGKIIVGGGSPTAAWTPATPNPCYVYEAPTDTWTAMPNVPIPVLGAYTGSVLLAGGQMKFILASGYTGSATTAATQIVNDQCGYRVYGNVYYGTTGTKAMATNTTVTLTPGSTISTGAGGAYQFAAIANGNYLLTGATTKPGANAQITTADAILVTRMAAGLGAPYATLQYRAGDVNLSNAVTTSDAILIKRRAAGLSSNWSAPVYVFDGPFGPPNPVLGGIPINVSGSDVTQILRAILTGDLNSSYTPTPPAE